MKHNKNDPVITVKSGKENTYCHEVEILGNSKVIYGGNDKPLLSCGARVVIETESDVRIVKWKREITLPEHCGKTLDIR